MPGSLQVVVTSMILRQLCISVLQEDLKEGSNGQNKTFINWVRSEGHIQKFNKYKTEAEDHKPKTEKSVLSAYRRHIQTEEYLAGAFKEVQNFIGMNSSVDLRKFWSTTHIYWKPQDNLDVIKMDPDYGRNVYSFTYRGNWDKSRLIKVPPFGSGMVLKVYSMEINDFENPIWVSQFCNEVTALTKIVENNKKQDAKKIKIPEIYDYGRLATYEESQTQMAGFYILMSYVEDEEEIMEPAEVENARKKIEQYGRMLKNIGIVHGDESRRNMRINRSCPMFIDYSHAKISDEPAG